MLQEGIGCEQHAGFRRLNPLRDGLCLQRRWMQHDRVTRKDRPERSRRQAIAMKCRQRIEELICRKYFDMLLNLFDISQDIGMGKHDAFRRAFCARGEQDHTCVVMFLLRQEKPGQDGAEDRPDFCTRADLLAHIFQIKNGRKFGELFNEFLQPAEFDKLLRRHNCGERCRRGRSFQIRRTGREIQHSGSPACTMQSQ